MDPLYLCFTRLTYIEKYCGDQAILRVRITRYKGKKVILAAGMVIDKNDILLKTHLHIKKGLCRCTYSCRKIVGLINTEVCELIIYL
ncbi:YkoP family protein [Virgibacillus alimentarius]|uniref:YkoP family protein n=1 Tax=Virgibacillus alimentarius TaxID=698769 RepID=UPI003626B7BB